MSQAEAQMLKAGCGQLPLLPLLPAHPKARPTTVGVVLLSSCSFARLDQATPLINTANIGAWSIL